MKFWRVPVQMLFEIPKGSVPMFSMAQAFNFYGIGTQFI